jgi:excisionase family DNA binding protein
VAGVRRDPGASLLTVEQVALQLQVHPESVRRWIRRGRLPAARIGGTKMGYRIQRADVERLLDGARSR